MHVCLFVYEIMSPSYICNDIPMFPVAEKVFSLSLLLLFAMLFQAGLLLLLLQCAWG